MNKILSISIAAYNAEKYLDKCLKSLLDTEVKNELEIIIVNDGSKDGTLKKAESYHQRFPDIIKVIDKENGGHGSTINASIKAATGKYYKILDSDDWVDGNGLVKLVKYLKTESVDLVLNPYNEVYIDTGTSKLMIPYNKNQEIGKILNVNKLTDVNIYMHSITFKTEVVKNMGPIIDEKCFYVDMEYACFAITYIHDFVCLDYPVYQYMLGSNEQSMNTVNLVKRRDQHLKVIKRIVHFYSNIDNNNTTKHIINKRIKYAICNQYKIYFNVKDKKSSKKEMVNFDKWLLDNCKDCYRGPKSKFMKTIYFLRKTNFNFYDLVYFINSKFGGVSNI